MIRAVIFDLDDTLYPERAYALGGFSVVAEKFAALLGDFDAAMNEMVRLMDEGFRGHIFDELLARRGISDGGGIVAKMITAYRGHQPRIQFHPDAAAALHRLKSMYRLGVITDGAREQQWAKIDALGLRDRVEEIIVTSELSGPSDPRPPAPAANYGKPHPFAFERIVERFGVAPHQCAYVADNLAKDFVAPNALGWLTVHVERRDGIYLGAAVADGGAAGHRIGNLDQLDAVLESHR